jgi:two-component system, NarL family, response regulator LiaR
VLERIVVHAGVGRVTRATTLADALSLIEEHRPDLFVMDVELNGSWPDGMALLRDAVARVPSVKAVVVSESDDRSRIEAALSTGAAAYVLKRARPEDLATAIRQALSQTLYLASSEVGAKSASITKRSRSAQLTRREREILELVAEGKTNGQVAQQLSVTEQTVKFHLAHVFKKLNVTNRTQASRWALAHGLLRQSGTDELASGERAHR